MPNDLQHTRGNGSSDACDYFSCHTHILRERERERERDRERGEPAKQATKMLYHGIDMDAFGRSCANSRGLLGMRQLCIVSLAGGRRVLRSIVWPRSL